jgi:transposase
VPPARAEVTEYRRHALRCLACGALTRADWPEDVPRGAFGPRAQAIVAYLTGRLGASHRDGAEVMAALHGLSLSAGSVSAIQRHVSHALAAPAEAAARFARQQASQHVDETRWRETGRLKWLWVSATDEVTTFEVLDGRGADGARRMIDPEAKGIVTTDRYGCYNRPAGGGKSAEHTLRATSRRWLSVAASLSISVRHCSSRPGGSSDSGTRRAMAT